MRTPTESELLVINGNSQKLSKNELKKLYDMGGVITPYAWATLVDNVSQDEVPIIYTADELYNLSKNKKLIPGHIYYTEYYGELRNLELINGLTSIQIIALKALSTSEFARGYDFNGRSFNIEFQYTEYDAEYDDYIIHYGSAYRANVKAKVSYINSAGEFANDTRTIPIVIIDRNNYEMMEGGTGIILYTDLYNPFNTRIYNSESDNMFECISYSLYCMIDSMTNSLDVRLNHSFQENGTEFNITINDSIQDYEPLKYVIQLNDIIDANNNYFEKFDYGTSFTRDLSSPSGGLYYKFKCIINSYNNKIYGSSIIALRNCKNNIIENSIFKAADSNNNKIINSINIGHMIWTKDEWTDSVYELASFLNNCEFIDCRNMVFEPSLPDDYLPETINSESYNVNNIRFRNIKNYSSKQTVYFNCVRPMNSSFIELSQKETKEININGYTTTVDIVKLN